MLQKGMKHVSLLEVLRALLPYVVEEFAFDLLAGHQQGKISLMDVLACRIDLFAARREEDWRLEQHVRSAPKPPREAKPALHADFIWRVVLVEVVDAQLRWQIPEAKRLSILRPPIELGLVCLIAPTDSARRCLEPVEPVLELLPSSLHLAHQLELAALAAHQLERDEVARVAVLDGKCGLVCLGATVDSGAAADGLDMKWVREVL